MHNAIIQKLLNISCPDEVVDSIIKYLDDSDTVVGIIWIYRNHLIQLITKFY